MKIFWKYIYKNANSEIFNEIKNLRLENGLHETGSLTFNGTYCMPIEAEYGYTITNEFGYRIHPITGKQNGKVQELKLNLVIRN